MNAPQSIFQYKKYWAKRFGTAPFLPMSKEEMGVLGWDQCDIILVTGDAYVDHPSFGMAIVGRLLENQGFRVGIIAQPDWHDLDAFKTLGEPKLFFGVTAGNMDSMVNRYTSDRKIRTDDAYTPNAAPGKRPDRSVIVYSQKVRQAFKNTPIVLGGIESSLRRIAHYDYWSEKIRRSVLLDAKADLLLFGNAERALVDVAHRIASGASIKEIKDIRGTVFVSDSIGSDWVEQDSTAIDRPGKTLPPANPYQMVDTNKTENIPVADAPISNLNRRSREKTLVRLPSYETVRDDPVMYAHTSRVLHLESNPGNARILIQQHGDRDVWINPPPIPLEMEEMDKLYELPYAREPHPSYGKQKIPAFDMIRFSVTIQRGCFGGCTFCSITEHEGRIIQNRSEKSIVREVEHIRDKAPDFTGVISDLGGPTANMYRLACKSKSIETSCRKLSCVYPRICPNLNTNHNSLIN
jgi:uncharacterized radical SAM protein YgiQ